MKTRLLYFIFLTCTIVASDAIAQTSVVWQKTVGGSNVDSMTSISIGTDNTFVMCGSSKSNISGNKSEKNLGGYDYWVVKMDFSGNILWNKTFGGAKDDLASAIITTSDGGYLVGGTSVSDKSATKSSASFKKSKDYWVLKLDAGGNKVWDKTLGGIYTDKLTSLAEVSSGKYVVGGYSYSDVGGTKNSLNIGSENTCDYWMIVLDKNSNVLSQSIFGGTSADVLTGMAPTSANTVYMGGYSYSGRLYGL